MNDNRTAQGSSEFSHALAKKLLECSRPAFDPCENYDRFRLHPRELAHEYSSNRFLRRIRRRFTRETAAPATIQPETMASWLPLFGRVEKLFDRLEDGASKRTLVEVIAYRLLGPRFVKLSLNTDAYWRELETIAELRNDTHSVDVPRLPSAHVHDLSALGIPVSVCTLTSAVQNQFVRQQYACEAGNIGVQPGATVIDGGGCFGDSALQFAFLGGESAVVHSFEFLPSNLGVFEKNLELNPSYANRIKVHNLALWSSSGNELTFLADGPATRTDPAGNLKVQTVSIDDFVQTHEINRVDFVKMDIEGAEHDALLGARQTICRDKPQLAVCVYHQEVDFVRLFEFLDELNLGYRFYLGHYTILPWETVLYATV